MRRRFTSCILAAALAATATPAFAATSIDGANQVGQEPGATVPDSRSGLMIDKVYGGGGKGDTPISNSFVELYNATSSPIDLSGYVLSDGAKELQLSGVVPAKGSFLIVGAQEATSDDYLTYDLPQADLTCDWVINNKTYSLSLKQADTVVDVVEVDGVALQVSKQKVLGRIGHIDTDTVADFQVLSWKAGDVVVDAAFVEAAGPRNSLGQMGAPHASAGGDAQDPTYVPVVAGTQRVQGLFDQNVSLKTELAGRYNSGAMSADGGSLEIVTFNKSNGYAYAVSGVKGKLIAVKAGGQLKGQEVIDFAGTEYDVKALVPDVDYGDMTSVSVSPDGSKIAVAIQAQGYADAGSVALFACAADGSLQLLSTVQAGVQPDMLTFADDKTILVANEGEPRNGVVGADPKGSVSVVTVGDDNAMTCDNIGFEAFDDKRDDLVAKGVLIRKGSVPSTDFEPEYIAVAGDKAYVALQENNAIAVLDLTQKAFTGVHALGFQDYGKVKVDLEKNGTAELKNYEGVFGVRMPDGISVMQANGKTYVLTANEGDSRADWNGLDNELESTTSPSGKTVLGAKAVWINPDTTDGLSADADYVFGSRSFSLFEVTDSGLELVFDSGSDFEAITAQVLPQYFNCSNDKTSLDNRSGKKGPEPETVVVGTVGDTTYAFVALERVGGVMVYDVTDPAKASFVNYINSREFDAAIQGDVSPEGLCFIPAEANGGQARLLAACEVSGTLAAYDLSQSVPQPQQAAQSISVAKTSWSKVYGNSSFSLGAKAKTALTYKSSNTKVATVSSTGRVYIKGAGTAKITISAKATDQYKAATKTVTIKVAKKDQVLTVSTAKKTAAKGKYTTAVSVKGAKTSKSFKKVSGSKYLGVTSTGKIKVSAKAKRGATYSVKLKVSARETANYKPASKIATIKVKVG
ncbi:MAG: choice-of-anchor I family protein [Coriobacteriia bacterium]|nr:choice-of-anchor I family protein [Coriobacteriia bacterium]